MGRFLLACCALVLVAGCSSSSRPSAPTVAPARTFSLAGFGPARVAHPGPTTVSFTIRRPSGAPLTHYRRGAGPHTGVHLIVVRRDLGAIIHKHPPIGPDGRLEEAVTFPTPGRYRVIVDAYPNLSGPLRNFQLFRWVTVKGQYTPKSLPAFSPNVDADGYRFTMRKPPPLRAIKPAFLQISVRRPDGKPATFTPWFGALAHAIFLRAGTLDYFHTHVCSPGMSGCTSVLGPTRVTGSSTSPGKLRVGVLLPVQGTWRLFLQGEADGRVLTAPFTLNVR
jgi:hypothetical protein